jgi:hypothetical protein
MPHAHPVVDSDSRFVIDSTTREITTSSSKTELIQGDHQSERITFEIPKIVEGHDMSLCDRIEIHYINTDKKTKATSKDVYIADDVTVDGDKLTFTWLISSNATKYQGALNFTIIFMCLDDEGNYTYKWSTEICKLLTVGVSIYNSGHVVNNYSDVLETFRREVIDEAKKYVDDKTIAPTSDDSLELLAETGIITPVHQDGVIYTAPTGEIYVI